MAILNHMSDIPYLKKTTDVDPYIEAFDINNNNIDFDTLDSYKESNYVYNADNLDELSDSINIMQNNWNNDVIGNLSDKYNLYQSWINNLKSTAKPWNNASWISDPELTPYLFRKSPDLNHIYNAEVDSIVGASVAWNQLIPIASSSKTKTENGITFTDNRDGTYTVSGTATADTNLIVAPVAYKANRVYAYWGCPQGGSDNTYFFSNGINAEYGSGALYKRSSDSQANTRIYVKNGTAISTPITFRPQFSDITALFGSATIADYVYSLEQTTAGAGVAWLRNHGFIDGAYHEYDSGSLKSVEGLVSHDTVGFNQWDEEWESGTYDSNTDTVQKDNTDTTHIRSKNPIEVKPNSTYYMNSASKNVHLIVADAEGNVLYRTISLNNGTFTTPTNGAFVYFNMAQAYGTTYNHDICINISDPSRNGEYEQYRKHSYPLDDSLTLRGIYNLDAHDRLYADGDEYAPDGSVTRKWKQEIDLGTLTYQSRETTAQGLFLATVPSDYKYSADVRCICSKYICKDVVSGTSTAPDEIGNHGCGLYYSSSVSAYEYPYLYIYDTSLAGYTPQQVASALSGEKLTYPLATPTTESADPYQQVQIVDDFGTEEYVDNRTVTVPVGHNTKYLEMVEIIPIEYHKNDMVTYVNDDGAIFLCIQDCNGSESLPDAFNPVNSYWARFYNKGETGENSCDLQWRGEWNIENTYSVKDVVWHSTSPTSTSFFVCIKTASGQQILNTEYWVSFYTIWTDTLDTYDNMPNQSWFDTKSNPTIFGVRDDDEDSNYDVVQFVNRVESESALNPAYVDMGSDISSLLVYYNDNDESYQSLIDVWNSFIKNNNLYSNVRR